MKRDKTTTVRVPLKLREDLRAVARAEGRTLMGVLGQAFAMYRQRKGGGA